VALTATASYLTVHHTGPLAPATAAVHGYSVAFTVSAILFGVGAVVAALLVPSRRRLEELRAAAQAPAATATGTPAATATPAPAPAVSAAPGAPGDGLVADGSVQGADTP
jgi:hypothetical protein